MSDNGPGTLEVGTNDKHEVVINLPQDMTGHIVFSPMQARILADSLIRKSIDAEREHRQKREAERVANVPPVDRSKACSTSGRPADIVRAEQTEETGQHKDYVVLCEDERKRGFVRPYRDVAPFVKPSASQPDTASAVAARKIGSGRAAPGVTS